MCSCATNRVTKFLLAAGTVLGAASLALVTTPARAQFGLSQQVGGVWVDADGVLRNREVDETNQVRAAREAMLHPVPADARALGLRKISLRRLEEAITAHRKSGEPLTDEMKYLAGLQQIQYVFVYPELNDIVLAGPGEGWKINAQGDLVGLTTGRPVMWLDDLLVALRTADATKQTGISCSIDPSDDGIVRLRSLVKHLMQDRGELNDAMAAIEETLGPQKISINGIPADSHFARVIIAADYHMKRLAMNFEPSPVKGLPSYLDMIKGGAAGMQNMLPRWWLEPNYQALLVSPDGLAFEIRGASVKAVTQEDFVNASGGRERTAKVNSMAKKWADNMTARYDELSAKDAIFGQLRNCIDLAVVASLIVKDQLPEKANYSMSVFLHDDQLATEKFNLPTQVSTQASVLQKGSNWLISASGGVEMHTWQMAAKTEPTSDLAPIRQKAVLPEGDRWWWN
jgi:Protein of unknown function (DUF1598)